VGVERDQYPGHGTVRIRTVVFRNQDTGVSFLHRTGGKPVADIKYLKGVQVAASPDGSGIILAGSTESDGILTIGLQSEALGRIVCDLLRLAAEPKVAKRAPTKAPIVPGSAAMQRPFRVQGISVAKVPMAPGTALCIDFPGIERISIGLSLDESSLLSQQLQQAVHALRSVRTQRPN